MGRVGLEVHDREHTANKNWLGERQRFYSILHISGTKIEQQYVLLDWALEDFFTLIVQ